MNNLRRISLSHTDKYQIVVIMNPYDTFEKDPFVRRMLAENWALKLRGYKSYFPYGVMPNDHYDYISNHIIICRKDFNAPNGLTPVAGIKNVTHSRCEEFHLDLPIYAQVFKGREEEYTGHINAIKNWITSRGNQEVAYSMGFTIEPSLDKEEKKFLCDLTFFLFPHFYMTYDIPNVIHGINKRFKLDARQAPIGFNILADQKGQTLSPVKLKAYDDVEVDVMVLEKFKPEFIAQSAPYTDLWNARLEILPAAISAQKTA